MTTNSTKNLGMMPSGDPLWNDVCLLISCNSVASGKSLKDFNDLDVTGKTVVAPGRQSVGSYLTAPFLFHMNGQDGSTEFLSTQDMSADVRHVAHGNVYLSSAKAKFGQTSAYFGNSQNDYLNVFEPVLNPNWGPTRFPLFFAFECWVNLDTNYYPTLNGPRSLMLFEEQTGYSAKLEIVKNHPSYPNSTQCLRFKITGDVDYGEFTCPAPAEDSWNHIVVSRTGNSGDECRIFINGELQQGIHTAADGTQNAVSVYINRNELGWSSGMSSNEIGRGLGGFMDEVLFSTSSDGVRYTAQIGPKFIPPKVPYVSSEEESIYTSVMPEYMAAPTFGDPSKFGDYGLIIAETSTPM